MKKLIPSACVPISLEDIKQVLLFLFFQNRSESRIKFHSIITNLTGFKYVRTFQSGYLALYFILQRIKETKKSGRVLVPVYTCPSVHYAVLNAGHTPVYVDADLENFNCSVESYKVLITPDTKVIIVCHLFGCLSVQIDELRLALGEMGREDIVIIEDMCQSLGNVNEMRQNTDQYADFGILSFGRAKMISTGNGGALLSFNRNLLSDVRELSQESIISNIQLFLKICAYAILIQPVVYNFAHRILGYKRSMDPYNLNDYRRINHDDLRQLCSLQVCLGLIMLNKLDSFNAKRKLNSRFYLGYFNNKSNYLVQPNTNNFYLRFAVIFRENMDVLYVQNYLNRNGIDTSTMNYPLLSEIVDYKAENNSKYFENASNIASNILTFPTHPNVDMSLFKEVFDDLLIVLERNSKSNNAS